MQWIKFFALFFGVFIGGFGTAFFLQTSPMNALASVAWSDGWHTESGIADAHAPVNEPSRATSVIGTNMPPASSTSTNAVKVPVLVYHSIRPHTPGESKEQDMYDITPELFESELVFIRDNGYTTITFADVIAHFDNGTPLPEKPIILSFDDGWRNQYAYAFPLLKRYGMKGTFFVFTNPLMHHNVRWVSWNEVREMDSAGMEIAGHTHTHPFLTKLTTDEELDKEISASKKFIEEEIGHPITVFAYPFGEKNPQVERVVVHAGYKIARTIVSGVWNDPAHRFEFHGSLASDRFSDFERLLRRE
jgi:peptidoglycan/xylan/chitin deacetylase (PgdA/CDA1 family)